MSDQTETQRIARIRLPNKGLCQYDGETFKFDSERDQERYERGMRMAIATKPRSMIHQPDPLLDDATTAAYAAGGIVEFIDPLPSMPDGTIY